MPLSHFKPLLQAVDNIEGVLVECGLGGGNSLRIISELMTDSLIRTRQIYGFDSFQGLPRPSEHDNYYEEGRGYHTPEEIQLVIDSYNNLEYTITPGWFSDTLPLYPKYPIAVLHIDVDIYVSYRECLLNLYEYVQPGGLILFDEYNRPIDLGKWPGAKKGIDSFFEPLGIEIQTYLSNGMAYMYKPVI